MLLKLPRARKRLAFLTSETYNAIADFAEWWNSLRAGGGIMLQNQGGPILSLAGLSDEFVFAKITSQDATNKNVFAWSEADPASDGTWSLVTGGKSGTTTDEPAIFTDPASTTDFSGDYAILFKGTSSDNKTVWVFGAGGGGSSVVIKTGYLTADWTPGTDTINVQPCIALDNPTPTSDPPVTVYLRTPVPTHALYCGAYNGDVIAYVEVGLYNLIIDNPLPAPPGSGTDQYHVWINMGTAATPNFQADFVRASA